MSPEWITAGCAAAGVLFAVIGFVVRPFMQIHGKLDCLRNDLKGIGDKLRDHDESLRKLLSSQKVLLSAMKGVIRPEVHAVTDAALDDKAAPFKVVQHDE